MDTLFPIQREFPEGFAYYEDFISKEEEDKLSSAIDKVALHAFEFQGYTAKKKVASFGYDWSFDKRILTKGKDVPENFHFIIEKVAKFLASRGEDFAEFLVTEYPIGSVINWHRDAPPFDLIAGISLKSDCIFKLRPHDKTRQGRGSVISFPVRRRSLYVMQGPARSEWQHSIAAVKDVRYSITLRTLKQSSMQTDEKLLV